MRRTVASTLMSVVLIGSGPGWTQTQPEVVVRQGDTIEWVAAAGPPHKVKFGGAGTTSIEEILEILEFDPALSNGESKQGSGLLLKATVKEKTKDKTTTGRKFVFTCGVHPAQMLSVSFVVAAKVEGEKPRTHTIVGEPPLHWHLHVDTTK